MRGSDCISSCVHSFTFLKVTGIPVLYLPHARFWLYVHMFKMPKTVSSKVIKYHTVSTASQIVNKKKCLDVKYPTRQLKL